MKKERKKEREEAKVEVCLRGGCNEIEQSLSKAKIDDVNEIIVNIPSCEKSWELVKNVEH